MFRNFQGNLGGSWFITIPLMLLLTDLAILLNIPFLRQILGFLFLTILPGLLIVQILKLDKIDFIEKFILSWGLSISFLMLFGLLINNLSLSLGYGVPLSTISLLIVFNITFIMLVIIGYKIKTFEKSFIKTSNLEEVGSIRLKNCLPNINLSASEKAFLIVPILFPALSIFGMHMMNTTDSNIILMFLLFLIPIYIIFVCLFNQNFSKRLYPVVIFLISLSLLLLYSLRSNHIIGVDVHYEYYFFQTTFGNMHWSVLEHSTLDACLSISLLPTIYQSILDIPSEFLFKILYSLTFSISPIVVYILSKRYVGDSYGFLASCLFMFQSNFLLTEYNPRTNTAILFFALAMMTLFNDRIDPLKKRILFIVFMASCIVSHYSTTYIFFFILIGSFVGVELLSKKYTVKKVVSLTLLILFFSMIFLWYSQVTEKAFCASVSFIENTLTNLNMFFVEESRSSSVSAIFGSSIMEKGIPHKIEFVFTWLIFVLIGIGVITGIRRYNEMSFPELNFKKPDFLKNKFEVGYSIITLACSGLLVAMVALPHVTVGYSIDRLYGVALIILSVFFIIGGITLSKNLSFKKKGLSKKQKEKRNTSEVRAYLIILLVLIPYFLCVTGVMYNIFDVPRSIVLNSEGESYDRLYVHDHESYGAKWLKMHSEDKTRVCTDFYGKYRLISQAPFSPNLINMDAIFNKKKIRGYIYLGYYGVVNRTLLHYSGTLYNLSEYDDVFLEKHKIYNNGGTEVWK